MKRIIVKNVYDILSHLEFKDIGQKDNITINSYERIAYVVDGDNSEIKEIDITDYHIPRKNSRKAKRNERIVDMATSMLGLDIDGDVVLGYTLIHMINKAKTELANRTSKKRYRKFIKWITIVSIIICIASIISITYTTTMLP